MTFWRWVALALVVAACTVYGMGRRLPMEHRAVAEGVVQASQDRVWRLVDDNATQTQWRANLLKISPVQDSADGRCWLEAHRTAAMKVCQVEEVPKSRMVLRMVGTKKYGGTWTFTFRPVGPDATEVTMVEDGWVNSALLRFLGHYAMGEQTNVKQYLSDLQAEAVRRRS
jgi:hypothetical protein